MLRPCDSGNPFGRNTCTGGAGVLRKAGGNKGLAGAGIRPGGRGHLADEGGGRAAAALLGGARAARHCGHPPVGPLDKGRTAGINPKKGSVRKPIPFTQINRV